MRLKVSDGSSVGRILIFESDIGLTYEALRSEISLWTSLGLALR